MAFSNPNLLADNASTFEGGTTAWVTTGGNTTLSVVTSEFIPGGTSTRSMRMTATAAGSIETISPRWTVSEGKTFAVRLPIRQNTTTAGKIFTGRITWFDAPSGGNSLGAADFSQPLNTTSGWWNANHVITSGVAPAGAKSATVKITVTGLAAGEFVNTDDVYAAEVPRRVGDMLTYNTGSCENDASGWTVTNGAIGRGVGTLYGGAGYYVLSTTSVAAGDMPVKTNLSYAVTPGADYVAYGVVHPTWAADVSIELYWYDAGAAQIGTETRTVPCPAATNTRIAVAGTAPAGAASVRLVLRPVATAGAQVFYADDMSLCPVPNKPGNLLTYEEFSTESVLPAWTLDGGTGLARTYLTSNITDGFFTLAYTPVDRKIHRLSLDRLIPVTPGTTYAAGAHYFGRNQSGETTPVTYRVLMDWYDASGVLLLADNPDGFYTVNIANNTINGSASTETRTAPEGAAFARVVIEFDHSYSLCNLYYVDNVSFLEATPEYELVSDNATGAVRLTVNYIPPVNANSAFTSIHRIDEDGKTSTLRGYGAEWRTVPTVYVPLVIEDYEAPLGTRVSYAIRWTNADGTVRSSSLFTQTITAPVIPDPDYVWFKSPGNPALNTMVLMEAPLKWSRAARSARYDVVGRKNPIHKSDVRGGRTAGLTILVWDPSSNALFDSLLDSGLPVLIQAMPGYGIEGNLYLAVGDSDVEQLSPDARVPGWRWSLAVTEVDRPEGGLQGSALTTWQSIYDGYATWEDLFDAHETWVTVLTKG
ncbi:hypothetical protein [Streptomyces narbonensis]|uniref:hypothetical protein n=1 Tax=Streptomyces narbonensis TaxID=67333 RepID=UPI0033E4F9B3